ncbi:MAG: hypothetical protein AAFQ79_09125 [Pseudomonadota bacterium]
MKIKVTQGNRKAGLLGGKIEWETTLTLTATEEEKAIISAGNIGGFPVASFPSIGGAHETEYTANDLVSREIIVFSPNQWHANDMAKKLKGAAAGLKSLIEETAADETGEFEL